MGKGVEIDDISGTGPLWFRYLVIVTLLSSAGSGFLSLNKEIPESYTQDVIDDKLESRDERIDQLTRYAVQHSGESAKYIEKVERLQHDVTKLRHDFEQYAKEQRSIGKDRSLAEETQTRPGTTLATCFSGCKEFTTREKEET